MSVNKTISNSFDAQLRKRALMPYVSSEGPDQTALITTSLFVEIFYNSQWFCRTETDSDISVRMRMLRKLRYICIWNKWHFLIMRFILDRNLHLIKEQTISSAEEVWRGRITPQINSYCGHFLRDTNVWVVLRIQGLKLDTWNIWRFKNVLAGLMVGAWCIWRFEDWYLMNFIV